MTLYSLNSGCFKLCTWFETTRSQLLKCELFVIPANLFDLCGNQMFPDWHIKRTEDLVLTIDNNWPVGERSCTVRLAAAVSHDTLYYRFKRFHASDSSSYMTLTLKSNYGYSTQVRTLVFLWKIIQKEVFLNECSSTQKLFVVHCEHMHQIGTTGQQYYQKNNASELFNYSNGLHNTENWSVQACQSCKLYHIMLCPLRTWITNKLLFFVWNF